MEFDPEKQDRTRRLLRTNSAMFHHMNDVQIGDEAVHAKPPALILWCPPDGRPLASPTMEEAQRAASNYAGSHPGTVNAVYQLVGYAYAPLKPAPFLNAPEPVQIESTVIEQTTDASD
jgi:hypothetical protein